MFPTHQPALRVLAVALLILSVGSITLQAAPPIKVETADPPEAEQQTSGLPVTVTGRGFPSSSSNTRVEFFVTTTTNNGGVTVQDVVVLNSKKLIATIDVAESATVSSFDVEVIELSSGRKGKGIGLFRVLSKGSTKPPEDPACPVSDPMIYDCIDGVDEHLGRPIGYISSLDGDTCPDFFALSDAGIRLFSGASGLELPPGRSPIPRRGRARDNFGYSVADAGDWNGDGYTDLVVGSPGAGGQRRGQVFVISGADGSTDFLEGNPYAVGDHRWMNKGWSVAGLGDYDNDDQPEILVGSHDTVHIFEGPDGGDLFNVYSPEGGEGQFGYAVAAGGDLNGDGTPDFAVGAPGSGGTGRAHAYSGSDHSILFSVSGQFENDEFGSRLDIASDVDGDGCDDVVVGARRHDGLSGQNSGAFYVYGCDCHATAPSCSAAELKFGVSGSAPEDFLGGSVVGVGDLNGDDRGEVLVGAAGFDLNRGKATLYSYDPLSGPSVIFSRTGLTNQFGRAVAGQVDENLCGMPEIMIEEPYWGIGSDDGRIYLYRFNP